ncbi:MULTISPECIES: peptidoglycan-binding protein [Actinomycetes]|uniref:peptidoglycan-binding protein n=1 Tax=Actinomycetes TaxID=1760 RepID=UPI0001B56185|nr:MULTISPECIES: peptidoglycan-binding protein [Actinomycetes]EFL12543.1 hypothetical protein SSMG_08214 [Streptomyces sp. AA4]
MTRWKPLPAAAAPQVRDLVDRLRELKDQAGISAVALARRTAYSRSSWTRCLNARTVPPRPVVEAFAEAVGLSGADRARLLALWELAEQAQAEPEPAAAVEREPAAEAADRQTPGVWRRRTWIAVAAGAVVAAGGAAAWLAAAGGPPPPSARVAVAPAGYSCDYASRDGRWYAGHSTASTQLVVLNFGGEDVAEVQCLLKRHGRDPGRVDGLFGERTEQAVKDFQRAAGAVVDGKVGPQTWVLLRG